MLAAKLATLLALKVVLWHGYRADEENALKRCVSEYNQQQKAIEIELVGVPADAYQQKLSAAIPLGNGPDLFIGAHDHLGEQVRAGLVRRVDDLLPASKWDRFFPQTVMPLSYQDFLYGVPLAFKSLALFYRRDLLPRAPQTTLELEQLVARLAPRGIYPLAYEAGSYFHHAPWLSGYGGQLLDAKGVPHLDTPAMLQSVELIARWRQEHVIPDETSALVATQLFNTGRAAATISGPWFLGEIAPGVPYEVAPIVTVSATGRVARPLLVVEALFVSSRSQHAREAAGFIDWLTDRRGAEIRATLGRQPVATASAWFLPAVASDRVLAAFRRQLDDTVALPADPAVQNVWEPAQAALRAVLRDAALPKEALTRAESRLRLTLAPAPTPRKPWPYLIATILLTAYGAQRLWRNRLRAPMPRARAVGIYAALSPAITAMLALVFIPFIIGGALSLFDYRDGHYTFIGLANFADLLDPRTIPVDDPLSFYFALWVTVLWTVVNVALHVALGVALALCVWRVGIRLRPWYRLLLLVPWAVPNYITGLIWKSLFHRQFGAINALLGLLHIAPVSWFSRFSTAFFANVATNVWLGFPFMMVTALAALADVPRDLEEAAALDGASAWQRLRHIILPLILPRMWPAIILGTIWTFNMFNIVFLVSGGEPDGATDILVSQAYRWAFTRGHRYGYAAAYAVLIFVLLWFFTRLLERDRERA